MPRTSFEGQKPPFTALPNWLAGRASALEIAVLWALQSHYPDIRPSLNRLSEVTGLARRTVSKVVLDLERKGWLQRSHVFSEGGRKGANHYELRIWDEGMASSPAASSDRAGDAIGQEMPYRSRAGDALGIGQEMHGDRAGDAHKEEQENKNKKTRRREDPLTPASGGTNAGTVPVEDSAKPAKAPKPPKATDPCSSRRLPAELIPLDLHPLAELLIEFWAVKKGTRSGSVLKRICNHLRQWPPEDQVASLEAAIAAGWPDVYERKARPVAAGPGGWQPRKSITAQAADNVLAFLDEQERLQGLAPNPSASRP